MRLAWFSPMPPVRSGIATCSADLVAALAREHEIDVYVDEPGMSARVGAPAPRKTVHDSPRRNPAFPLKVDARESARSPGGGRAGSAHDFVWRHRQQPYDLIVYQLGNSSHHDYLWPYLFRYPGLAVLHDARLHHARAAALLRRGRAADYRAEFAASETEVSADLAELAIAGFDSRLHYEWPFTRLVILASRMTAVHSRLTRDALGDMYPEASIVHVRLGHGTPVPAGPGRHAATRARYGIPEDAILFGCFGGLILEKRIPHILDAFAAVLPSAPSARLLLGGPDRGDYDVHADLARRGLTDRVVVTGYLETDAELTDCIAAADVTLNLRWPTALEISGPWLRCLAAGKPSIIIDLAHTADVPSLDPRTWTANLPEGAPPVAVAVDIMDEDHSLRLAMRRLANDPALRETLGEAARIHWAREHSHEAMIDDYRRVLREAADTPAGDPALPGHLRDDESGLMARILDEVGVPAPWSKI